MTELIFLDKNDGEGRKDERVNYRSPFAGGNN
jgi:hypothetical protein